MGQQIFNLDPPLQKTSYTDPILPRGAKASNKSTGSTATEYPLYLHLKVKR